MRTTILLVSLLTLTGAFAGPIYSVDDLGGLGGGTSVAFRINSYGEAVGWAQTSNGNMHAFSATAGLGLQDLSPTGVSDSYAYGVNNNGEVAGTGYVSGQAHGMILSQSGATDIGPGTYALAINDSGQVAGGNTQAMIYSNGASTGLGTLPGGGWSAAYDINNSGTVAGTSEDSNGAFRGFVWNAATGITSVGSLGGWNSYAMGINDGGMVAGFGALPSGYDHAFISSDGRLTDLGTLGGGSSFAYDINGGGAVVGYSWVEGDSGTHAFVYMDGMMLDLNSLIGSDSGWVLSQAFGINDAGQIVGTGTLDGQSQAFRLDPVHDNSAFRQSAEMARVLVPEPAPVTLLSIGILFLAVSGMLRTQSARRR